MIRIHLREFTGKIEMAIKRNPKWSINAFEQMKRGGLTIQLYIWLRVTIKGNRSSLTSAQ